MFWITYIRKLIKALGEDATPSQLASGFVLGAMVGLVPKFNLLVLGLCAVILFIRVNISMAILGCGVFAIIGAMTDPFIEPLGYWLLTGIPALRSIWTSLYNVPIFPWTSFNNTLVMGNLVFGLVLAGPLFVGTRLFVFFYRNYLRAKVDQWKIVKFFKATKVFQFFQRIRGD